jgi:two-component system chemotaxis response regulator CheY
MIKVLLIDDDATTLKLLSALIHRILDATITEASNGFEALHLMDKSNAVFDVIIVDIQMPIMNGMQFIKNLHELTNIKPIVFGMSASSLPEVLEFQIEGGDVSFFDGWLSKPISPNAIFNLLCG